MINANKYTSSQGKQLPAPYLPVDVQSVELVGAKELEGVVHEAVHAELVFGELLEGLGTERPASEGQHDLKGDGCLLWLLTGVLPFLSLFVSFLFLCGLFLSISLNQGSPLYFYSHCKIL